MKVCAHDFWPQCDKKSVCMCNRTEVNMNATKGENERELENEKRGRRQRCSKSAVCTNVGMKRHTLIGTCLEIHTHTHTQHADTKATHPQVSLLPGVAALLKHQCTEIKVHVQVRAHTHTHTRVEKCIMICIARQVAVGRGRTYILHFL